jgi:hypothetical protein
MTRAFSWALPTYRTPEQRDREGALAVGLLQLAALLQDFQRNGGRRHRKRERADDGAAPAGESERIGEACQCGRRQDELGGAEAEYGAAQRQQAREFELEADQEQQTTPSSDTVMMVSGARTKANPYGPITTPAGR